MTPQNEISRAQLIYLLEQNDLGTLFNLLKRFIQEEVHQEVHNDIILLSSRFEKYQNDNELQLRNDEHLQIEYNQIKYALQSLINGINLPQGDLNFFQKKKKTARQIFYWVLHSKWRWSILVTIVSLVILGLGQKRLNLADFELHARVSQIGVRTLQEWKIGQGQNLNLNQFEADVIQNASFSVETASSLGTPFSFQVNGRARLDQLLIPVKESLSVICDGDEIILRVVNGPIQGSLHVQNVELSSSELGLSQNLGVEDAGDQIDFVSDANPTFYLNPLIKTAFTLPLAHIDSIGFNRLSYDQDSSTIKEGLISIAGVKTALKLGDRLKVKLQHSELKLNVEQGNLILDLRGKIHQAQLTQMEKPKVLMPTWLAYMQQNQTIPFYVVLFAALFGFLSPLRKSFFPHKN